MLVAIHEGNYIGCAWQYYYISSKNIFLFLVIRGLLVIYPQNVASQGVNELPSNMRGKKIPVRISADSMQSYKVLVYS